MARVPIKFQLLAKAGFPLERFRSSKAIFDEGGKGDKMYVICSGEVTIEREGKLVEALSAGDIFGEMALIDGASRSATARAKTDCEVAPITERAFVSLVHKTPLLHSP